MFIASSSTRYGIFEDIEGKKNNLSVSDGLFGRAIIVFTLPLFSQAHVLFFYLIYE